MITVKTKMATDIRNILGYGNMIYIWKYFYVNSKQIYLYNAIRWKEIR